MSLRARIANWLLKAAATERQPLIASSQSGRAIWNDWSTENAIKHGLKASVWVYASCRKLAAAVSSVPWHVERRIDEETWEREPGHPIELLLKDANPYMSGQDLMERLTYHLNLGGNGIWHMVMARGVPVELWPLPPDRTKPVPHPTEWISRYEYTDGDGRRRNIDPKEILHFQFVDPSNPYWGLSPLKAAARIVDTDVEAVRWNKVSLQNRAITDGVFSFEQPLTPEQWAEARRQVREQHQGADNARTPWVLGGGAKWEPMSLTPVEMDFLESRKFSVAEIAAVFGVPVVLLSAERTTYNNMRTARRMLWEDTVVPILTDIKEALNLALVPFWDPSRRDLRIVYDLSNVTALQESLAEKVAAARTLWAMGYPVNVINQRLEMGLPDIPGGDEPRRTQYSDGAPFDGDPDPEPKRRAAHRRQRKADTWPEAEKAAFWRAMDTDRIRWEDRLAEEIALRFAVEGKAVAAAFEAGDEAAAMAAIDDQAREWRVLLTAAYTAIIEHFGQLEGARLENGGKARYGPSESKFVFDPWKDAVQRFVAQTVGRKITRILDTTKRRIAEAIAAGMAESETSREIAQRIEDAYHTWGSPSDSGVDTSRAFVIARTETGAAANFGHQEGARQTGLTIEKEWLSSRDERTRAEHLFMDGERVGLDERYSNGLMYPGDPAGEPDDVINCRCVELHHPK